MKVGLISFHSFSSPGGVKNHILGLKQEFKKRGIDTKILAPRRKVFESYGKDVILLGTSFETHFGGGENDFDIVFTPFSIERILMKEKFDILHFHNLVFPAAFQLLTSPLSQKPLKILTFHSNVKRSKLLERFPLFLSIFNRLVNWKIDGVIGVSEVALSFLKEYKGPKTIIPNGIDLEKFGPHFQKIKKFADSKINILFVGRIEERKGLIYLLKAYKILKEKAENKIRLIVVGEGDLKKECQDFVNKEKLKDVFFEGKKEGKELASYYATCHIFVAPSIFGESFGIILLEAMASARPVVAFDIEGYREVLKGEGARFLVKPFDIEELALKIERLIENPKLREEMGKWGEKEVQKYSWSKIAERVIDFYQSCLEKKNNKEI